MVTSLKISNFPGGYNKVRKLERQAPASCLFHEAPSFSDDSAVIRESWFKPLSLIYLPTQGTDPTTCIAIEREPARSSFLAPGKTQPLFRGGLCDVDSCSSYCHSSVQLKGLDCPEYVNQISKINEVWKNKMCDLFLKNSLWETPRMHFEKSKGNMSWKQICTLLSNFNFSLIMCKQATAQPINKYSPLLNGLRFPFAGTEDLLLRGHGPPPFSSAHPPFQVPWVLMSWHWPPVLCPKDIPSLQLRERHSPRRLLSCLGIAHQLGLVMFGVLIHFTKIAFHSLGDR